MRVDFNLVQPEDLWYIVGFITTDGNLDPRKHMINITSKDGSHILRIKDVLHLQTTIGWKGSGSNKQKIYSVLQFCDRDFYSFLESIGLMPKKSLLLGTIQVPYAYFPDFIRGVIDGDGCIRTWIHPTNHGTQWSLSVVSGSPHFIQWLHSRIESYFRVTGRVHIQKEHRKNTLYVMKFGKLAAKVILRRIYYEGALALERKCLLAKLCLQDESRMINYRGVIRPGAVIGEPDPT